MRAPSEPTAPGLCHTGWQQPAEDTAHSLLRSRIQGAWKGITTDSLETADVSLFAAAGKQLCQKCATVVTNL